MKVYYNEIDQFCCDWLSNLMDEGLISPGKIDNRSIEDVVPNELQGYERCHFFAGIGIWDLALNQAGWQGPVWTGSCPCQPFSAAGKGGGFADERHLWPAFFHLIEAVRPVHVLGEQVASKDGLAWFDLVQTDLESADYSAGAVDICAAGFGAPHIRQRLYWVAVANSGQRDGSGDAGARGRFEDSNRSADVRMADRVSQRLEERQGVTANPGQECTPAERSGDADGLEHTQEHGRQEAHGESGARSEVCRLGDTGCSGHEQRRDLGNLGQTPDQEQREAQQRQRSGDAAGDSVTDSRAMPTNGLWRLPDWLYCRDGKWRPVESETFPLAPTGTYRNRVAALRGSGNAINLAQAQNFIEAVMEL